MGLADTAGKLFGEGVRDDPFAAAVRATRMSMVITDPHRADNPIVFANDAFLKLTGYPRDEVIGRNCRFLQGAETDRETVRAIHRAIAERREIAVDLLNYRRDGSSFWNGLYISPVLDADGSLRHFFAAQLEVGDRVEAQRLVASQQGWLEREVARRTEELREALDMQTVLVHEVDHRVKNNIQMISALLALQSTTVRDGDARTAMSGMLQRVEAIGTVHRRLYQADDVRRFDLADFARDIARDLVKSAGRDDIALDFALEPVPVPSQHASPLALMLNELIVNALKHAFPDGRGGRIAIAVRRDAGEDPDGDGELRITVADDGAGVAAGGKAPDGFGGKLIRTLARQLRAELSRRDGRPGTIVELRAPLRRLEAGGNDV